MPIELIVAAILLCAPVALWGALCAINSMRIGETPFAIVLPFLCIAWGWGAVLFGALDIVVHQVPQGWPTWLLLGVFSLAVGNAFLFLANRRGCRCAGCPGRKAIRDRRDHPARSIGGCNAE